MSSQNQELRDSKCGVISSQSAKAAQQECGGASRQDGATASGTAQLEMCLAASHCMLGHAASPLQTSVKRDGSLVGFKVELKDGRFVLGGGVRVGDVSEEPTSKFKHVPIINVI